MAGKKKRRLLHQARQEAARQAEGVRLDADPAVALQEVLDRSLVMMRYAASQADELDSDSLFVSGWTGGENGSFAKVPHEWLRLEADLRQEVATLAGRMVQLGIADRAVALEEAKAAILINAILAAARKSGIARDQIKALGPAIREELQTITGAAEGDGKPAGRLTNAA